MTPKRFLWTLIGSVLAIIVIILIYVSIVISNGLPSLEQLENPKQNFATRVYSADGKLLDHYFIERRVWLPYDSIPKDFFDALIAVEDRDFESHWGINTSRLIKAAMFLGNKGGASTITQQLSRGLFFNMDRTLSRKIKEAFTAIQIEKTYTKQEILEMYANTVAFGRGAYGIQVAAQVYFGKPAYELSLSECAFLVGLLQRPEKYNGSKGYELAINRRNYVLFLMEETEKISTSQRIEARREPLNFTSKKDRQAQAMFANHFVEMIRQDLANDEKLKERDLYRDGLIIYTTLDSRIQELSQQAVEEHFETFQNTFNKGWRWNSNQKLLNDVLKKAVRNHPDYTIADEQTKPGVERRLLADNKFVDSVKNAVTTIQIGLTVLDPHNGAVLAMVGGSPKFMKENPNAKYSLNHVTQIKRQPGSTFKPFVYASALEQGLPASAQIESGPYSYTLSSGEVWSPRGSADGAEGGTLSLAAALQRSVNTVSARLITQHTTPSNVIELARRMGVKSPLRAVPALSLGAGGEVTPLEMVSAFSTFANEGVHHPPFYITRIEDQYGNIIYERKKVNIGVDAVSPKIAQTMTKFMQGTIDGGTGWRIRQLFKDCDAAGKTGTTNDFADAWFIGFTPQLAAGMWVGFDDKRVTFTGGYGYAGEAAAPLWGRLMAKIYSNDYLPYKQRKFNFSSLDSALANADSLGFEQEATPDVNQYFPEPTPANNPAPAPQPKDKQLPQPLPPEKKKRETFR